VLVRVSVSRYTVISIKMEEEQRASSKHVPRLVVGYEEAVEARLKEGRSYRYFLTNKPIGVTSSKVNDLLLDPRWKDVEEKREEAEGKRTVYDVVEEKGFPTDIGLIGRLDAQTSGLLMFTDDAYLAHAILHPPKVLGAMGNSRYKSKTYLLTLLAKKKHRLYEDWNSQIKQAYEEEFALPFSFSLNGVTHEASRPKELVILDRFQDESKMLNGIKELGWCLLVRVTLEEGKHHQIRRIAKRSDFHIVSLERIRLAGDLLQIESVPRPGDTRWLSEEEVDELRKGLGLL